MKGDDYDDNDNDRQMMRRLREALYSDNFKLYHLENKKLKWDVENDK